MKKIFCISMFLLLYVTMLIAAEKKIEILNIKINGLLVESEFDIFNNITLKEKEYTLSDFHKTVNESIKKLYATGNYTDIRFEMDKQDTSAVVINITEKPIIKSITVKGIKNLMSGKDDTEAISMVHEKITLRRNNRLDYAELKKIKNDIVDLYKEKGFYYAVVEDYVDINKQNYADITLHIIEGGEIKIKFFNLHYAEKYSGLKRRLKNMYWNFKLKTGKNKIFKFENFKNDIRKVKLKLLNNGYVNSKVTYDITNFKKENKVGIDFYIEMGNQHFFKSYTVKGNTLFDTKTISDQIELEKNKIFNYSKYMKTIKNLKTLYSEKGYLEAKITPLQKSEDDKLSIEFDIEEGSKSTIENIVIRGNVKTREKVIRRELLFKEGEVLNGKKVDLSRRSLVMLNFFDNVAVNIVPGSAENKKNIFIDVEEGRTGTISFGAGYSSVDKLVGFLEATKNNFDLKDLWTFTGKGQKIHIRTEFGKNRQNYELGWSDPWFNDDLNDTAKPSPDVPLYLGYDLYNLKRRPDDYDILRTGGNIRLGRRLGVYNRIYLKYKFERIEISDVDLENAPSDIIEEVAGAPNNESKDLSSSITLELNRNTTDSKKFPTKGYIVKLLNELSGGPLSGDVDFYKPTLKFSNFLPAFKTKLGQQVLAFNFELSTISNIFSSKDVPSYEKFFIGGADTIRGYSDREIKFYDSNGKSYGGKTEMIFNLEYRIPLVKDTLGMVLFYDGGKLNEHSARLDFNEMKFGYGFGFRIDTPMGRIRLDFGRRVNDTFPGAKDAGETEIHFNIGSMF